MMRNIFLPEHINSYYIFARRIVGIYIEKTTIYATVILAKGNKRIIEQCLQEPIAIDTTSEFQVRASQAVKQLINRIGSYDVICAALPSTQVVFKELSFPFTNLHKIKMILPFELEPLLPFPLSDATIDGIITHQDPSNKHAEVFAAAAKNELVEEQKNIFAMAGIPLHKITIDLLELINLYQMLPEFTHKEGAVVFLNIDLYATHIALFIENKLKAIRVLPKGMIQFARELALNKGTETQESFDAILNTDIGYTPQTKDHASKLLSDIPFTIESLLSKIQPSTPLNTVVITGPGIDIKGLVPLIGEITGAACIAMPINKLLHNGIVSARSGVSVNNFYIISLTTALSIGITKEFNLNKEAEITQYQRSIITQLITGSILILIIIATLSINSVLTIRKFRNEIAASEQDAIRALKSAFPILASRRDITRLSVANNAARQEVNKEESIWFALSPQNRVSIVTALQELSTRIDREGLGLDLKRLVIDETNVTMEGSVKDFKEARLLEDALNESGLFVTVPKLQSPKFMITMTLNKKREAS